MRQAHVSPRPGPHLVLCPSSRLGLSPACAPRPLLKIAPAPSDSTRWQSIKFLHAKRGASGLCAHVCRSQIGEALIDSIADLDVCQEVAEVLPFTVDLDYRLDGEHSLVGKLDVARVQAACNSLSSLWSRSGRVAQSKLAALPLSSRQLMSCLADNHMALQTGIFCACLMNRYNPSRPGGKPLDFYVVACLCVKVIFIQHVMAMSDDAAESPMPSETTAGLGFGGSLTHQSLDL